MSNYHFSEGTTTIHQFWGDMHILTFRADKVLNTWGDMQEVVERFEKDPEAFDRTLYNSHAENIKANRTYESILKQHKSLYKLVFEYQGQQYKTITTSFMTKRKIEKNADKIIEDKEIWAHCLVNDRTGKVIAVGEITSETDHEEYFI